MTVDPNMLTRPVWLSERTTAVISDGQRTTSWTKRHRAFVQFKDQRGAAFMAALQLNNKITHLIAMPYTRRFTAKNWRIEYEDDAAVRVLEVATVVDPNESKEEMIVSCIEKV